MFGRQEFAVSEYSVLGLVAEVDAFRDEVGAEGRDADAEVYDRAVGEHPCGDACDVGTGQARGGVGECVRLLCRHGEAG